MKSTKLIMANGVELYQAQDEDELKMLEARLIDRFQGDRYKAFVTVDESVGRVNVAEVQVFDLHDPGQLWFDAEQTHYWLEPVHRAPLCIRTEDWSPSIVEARDEARHYLDKFAPGWRGIQGKYGYLCIDLAVMPASEMDKFLYAVIL